LKLTLWDYSKHLLSPFHAHNKNKLIHPYLFCPFVSAALNVNWLKILQYGRNRQNNLLKDKYNIDPKYAYIHKRLVEKGAISEKESKILMLCNR